MKAISLWQLWATAMYLGIKKNETRSWPTKHRGDLAICPSKRPVDMMENWDVSARILEKYPAFDLEKAPMGAVLCIVDLRDVVRTEWVPNISLIEMDCGDYSTGRWAWMTSNLRPLKNPVPVIGHQGIFNLPADVELKVRAQLL